MIQDLFFRLLHRHHFWRTVGFDELSELYTAQLLRSIAINLIGLFTPVYLYTVGYSMSDIAMFYVFWFVARAPMDLVSARVIAKVGPKHAMLLSAFIHVAYLGFVITLEDLRWPLGLVAMIGSFAYSLHLLAVMVDFSKVKHQKHGGKELGVMEVMQRIGGVLGPLVGGIIANYTDPRYTIALAMLVLLGSAIPLFFSSEPVRLDQKISFKGMNVRGHIRDYVSAVPFVIENAVSLIIWPLYAAVFLLGNDRFAKLGIITAISTLFSLLVAHAIGSLIDARKGRKLLRISLTANAIIHLFRIVAKGPLSVLAINIANEPVTAGYRMPYMKGMYDAADSLPGYRIAYLASISALDAVARLVLWVVIWLGFLVMDGQLVLQLAFVIGALCSFGIMTERFVALKPGKK